MILVYVHSHLIPYRHIGYPKNAEFTQILRLIRKCRFGVML